MLSHTALLLLYPLAVLSSHRLWNRERIFAAGRRLVSKVPGLNCEECNIFWIALVWALILPLITAHPVAMAIYLATAIYAPVRFAMAAYPLLDKAPLPAPEKKCKTCGQGLPPHEKANKRPKRLAVFVPQQTWDQNDPIIAGLMTKTAHLLKSGEWYLKFLVPAGTDMGSIAAYYMDIQKATEVVISDVLDTVTLAPTDGIGQVQKHLMLMGNGLLLTLDTLSTEQKNTMEKAGSIRGFRTLCVSANALSEQPYDQFIAWLDEQRNEAVTRKT
jgi:hypothetical protein